MTEISRIAKDEERHEVGGPGLTFILESLGWPDRRPLYFHWHIYVVGIERNDMKSCGLSSPKYPTLGAQDVWKL